MALGRQANGCWALNGYPWSTCNVGGGTVFYGGVSFRYRPVDFAAGDYFPDADLPVEWPYRYADLELYYDEIETHIGVAAEANSDPLLPRSRINYLPPVPLSASARHIQRGSARLGWHTFRTPLAIATIPHQGRAACVGDSPCIEVRCPHGAKGDAETCFLKETLMQPNVRLFAGMKAVRLERDRANRVATVLAIRTDTRREYRFSAKVFLVAGNAIQSAALLLRSGDDWSPTGLGNEHDMVGRGLCMKLNEYVVGYACEDAGDRGAESSTIEGNGPYSTVATMNAYLDPQAPTGMGGLIYESRYGRNYSMKPAGAVVRLECLMADQPSRTNRVLLSRSRDDYGLPRLAIDYKAHPRDLARLEVLISRATTLLHEAGCQWIRREATDFHLGSCHLHGTCRAGRHLKSSVVDSDSRVHAVDNLYIIDGAFMPFPSGVNPTLTIQAHSLKTTEIVLRQHWHR